MSHKMWLLPCALSSSSMTRKAPVYLSSLVSNLTLMRLIQKLRIMSSRHFLAPGQNFRRRIQSSNLLQQLTAFLGVQSLYRFFDPRDQARACAQFVNSERQQEGCQRNLSCHLTAHTNPDSVRVSRRYCHFNQAQDCGMSWLV